MLGGTAEKDRLIASALELAKTRPWSELSLQEIASHAGLSLLEARHVFQSKAQILRAFSDAVDKEVLKRFPRPSTEGPRDRLFDVILTRFEIMEPYRPALRNIAGAMRFDFRARFDQVRPALKAQYWMLQAAALSGEGGLGLLRVKGLLGVYARVFQIWLDDTDAGLAKTMAALDKHLRRGESILTRVSNFKAAVERVCDAAAGRKEDVTAAPASTQGGGEAAASHDEPSPSI